MRSLVLDFDRRSLDVRELPQPELTDPVGVRFRVYEVGVCGTDREIAAFRLGRPPSGASRLILGHEGLGQVLEVGQAVTALKPGDWIVPMIRRPCPQACRSCARGRADLCLTHGYAERGIFGADGYFTEYAVDPAEFLIAVPERLIRHAVLMEPLSVVEKAVDRAIAIRQTDENSALVLGLGPVGMLAALVLQARHYRVRLYSLEPDDHPRAALMRAHGIEYATRLDSPADVIVEAAGSAELAFHAVRLLAPAGIFVALGAREAVGELSFIDLIVGNRTIFGSVNASRDSFDAALRDLDALPATALNGMIRRFAFDDYRATLAGTAGPEPKFVHVMAGG